MSTTPYTALYMTGENGDTQLYTFPNRSIYHEWIMEVSDIKEFAATSNSGTWSDEQYLHRAKVFLVMVKKFQVKWTNDFVVEDVKRATRDTEDFLQVPPMQRIVF